MIPFRGNVLDSHLCCIRIMQFINNEFSLLQNLTVKFNCKQSGDFFFFNSRRFRKYLFPGITQSLTPSPVLPPTISSRIKTFFTKIYVAINSKISHLIYSTPEPFFNCSHFLAEEQSNYAS